jgi:hypothetical protein
MATRMQQRRGTAAQWTAANPVLAAGEIGFETDTSKFKMGNGSSAWSALTYFANAAELAAIIDGAPATLNTLNELAEAMGDNPAFLTTISTNLETHTSDSTNIHGIADTSLLVTSAGLATSMTNLSNTLSGNLTTHEADTTNVHGIADTSLLATTANLTAHQNDTTNIHGIADTAALATTTNVSDAVAAEAIITAAALSAHSSDTTSVHGVSDMTALVTQTQLTNAISGATVNQQNLAGVGIEWNVEDEQFDIDSTVATKTYADDAVSTHNSDTSNVHGIADTAELATKTYADTAVSTHSSDTTSVHGIADTSALALTATVATDISTAVSTHSSDTTSVHGIADTADLLLKSGGTMTGALTLSADPSSSLHAATKQYVDNTASGVIAKPQVLGATTANIDATYNNGTAGVGATLTHNTNGAFPAASGGASGWAVGKGILVKNQTNKAQNGRYYVSNMGSASTPYVLTRCTYCDEASEIPGAYVFVQDGTSAGTGWIQVVADPATFVVGTDNIDVFQFSGSGTITAGTNISVSGNEVSVVATPSLSGVTFSDGTQTKEGVVSRTPIIAKTDSYTLSALTERDSLIEVAKSTATTITIPTDSTLNFPVGTSIDVLQTSTGQVTIAGAGGVTVNATPGLKLRTTWSSATLFKRAANTWVVFGDLTA